MKEECKGCNMIGLSFTMCDFVVLDQVELCPCIQCLVKVMCKESCNKRGSVKLYSSTFKIDRKLRNENRRI